MSEKEGKNGEGRDLGKEPVAESFGLTDPAVAETFRRITSFFGTATRVVVKRRSPQGKFQYVKGESIAFDPPSVNLQIKGRTKSDVSKRKPGSGNKDR